jgi:excisionase family DNA binding protein
MGLMVGRRAQFRISRKYEVLPISGERIVSPMNGTASDDSPANGNIPKRLVHSVPEVAVLLGVSVRYVWDLIARNELESIKIGVRRVVPVESLEAFIAWRRAEEQRVREAVAAS